MTSEAHLEKHEGEHPFSQSFRVVRFVRVGRIATYQAGTGHWTGVEIGPPLSRLWVLAASGRGTGRSSPEWRLTAIAFELKR